MKLSMPRPYACQVLMISQAREDVVQALDRAGVISRKNLIDLEIAVGEVLQNIVRHEVCPQAPCRFSIELDLLGPNLHVNVTDSCLPLQDLTFLTAQRTVSEKGGMGIELIKKISSIYMIHPLSNGNRHELIFNNFLTPT